MSPARGRHELSVAEFAAPYLNIECGVAETPELRSPLRLSSSIP
jgi:hypothetical protein